MYCVEQGSKTRIFSRLLDGIRKLVWKYNKHDVRPGIFFTFQEILNFSGWQICNQVLLSHRSIRVSIHKTFAKFLRNETQNFSFFVHQICAKKQQFAQSFAKVISRKIALFRFCETQILRNSATRVLRNSAIS